PLWAGNASEVRATFDGDAVPQCVDPEPADPCSEPAIRLPDGDIVLAVRSSLDGTWEFGRRVARFDFKGFFGPVDERPVVNVVPYTTAVPMTFSLGRDAGLDIFADGYPTVTQIKCPKNAREDKIERGTSWTSQALFFDPATQRYTANFYPQHRWRHSCRLVTLGFADGS